MTTRDPQTSIREGDARSEVIEFEQQASQTPMRFYNEVTGVEIDPGDVTYYRDARTREVKRFKAPMLTPDEERKAAESLRAALEAGAVNDPVMANHLLKNPHKLWLMAEMKLMLSPEDVPISNFMTADLMEGLTTPTAQREEYEYFTAHEETQQLFWEEIGRDFEQEDREFFINTLAQLSPRGANQVAAMALAWKDSHGLNTMEQKQQLFLNVLNWSAKEQDFEEGQTGFFGLINEPVKFVKEDVLSPLLNAGIGLIHGAEEAARRRDLTIGRQFAYAIGVTPPEEAGAFGWWNFISGGVDALTELGADPLAWVAGFGAGAKAVKTIPMAINATRKGRAVAAARALLPKPLTGLTKSVSGGRVARVTYAFRAKTVDDLLEATVKNGVASDAMNIIKTGNMSKFSRLYPAWKGLSNDAVRTIQEAVQTPEEFVEVLKADALRDVLASGEELADLTAAAKRSEAALRAAASPPPPPKDASTVTVRLPPVFYDDHIGRDLPGGTVLNRGKKFVDVELTAEEYAEMLSDARFYVEEGAAGAFDPSMRGLLTSARATLKKLESVSPTAPTLHRALNGSDEFVYHATSRRNADAINSSPGFARGSMVPDYRHAEEYLASHAEELGEGAQILVFRRSDLPPFMQRGLDAGNPIVHAIDEIPITARPKPIAQYDGATGLKNTINPDNRSVIELLGDEAIPQAVRLQAAKDHLRLATFNNKGGATFLLFDVPQRSKRIFSWQKVLEGTTGEGRLATGVRRFVARATPGRIPNSIDLFRTRQGVDDLRRLGEHFGLSQNSLDELIDEFTGLELGARQEWVYDTFIRRLGRETGVPAFEHSLVQFYRGSGIRNFSASGVDLLDDGSRIPLLSSQVVNEMPIPVDVLDQVFKRARQIGTRSKYAKALGFNGRGLGATKTRRAQLAARLRRALGEAADGLTDEQLHDMAFSLVSPNSGLDGRGIWAGKIMPKAGSWGSQLHQWFTKSMLVFRPIQWMWRVALLEEPIRAHLFNLPSIYSNPLGYMGKMREAHYVWNVHEWAKANMSWGQDVLATLIRGNKEDILKRLDEVGLKNEIFGGNVPEALRDINLGIEKYVENALYGRTRVTKLDPIKRVPWAVKNRSANIAKAEKMMENLGLPKGFEFADEAQEIAGRLVSGYLGEAVGSADRKLYQWQPGMSGDEAFTHGRVWGAKLIELVEDPLGRMALRRKAAMLRGLEPDVTGEMVVNSSRWQLLAPDLRVKYAGVGDDITIAERYMDDMLGKEIDHLFRPFFEEKMSTEVGELIDHFVTSRTIATDLGGQAIEWDLRGANYAAGIRSVGDFTAAVRKDATVLVPSNLPAPSFDPRFMAEDDRGLPARMANWVLMTFGEKATQELNRRPAWLAAYNRHYQKYVNLDIPAPQAQRLAIDHANKMVNHVFFNMNEAPYYVAKLNKFLPFFGATYEVVGTWSYKMPVAVGGTWPTGIGEFTRKFDRLIDGLVNIGLLSREEEEDGSQTITLNLVPPDSDAASSNELGRWLQGAGFAAVNTLDQAVSSILGLQAGLGLRSQGYRLAAGHPLNPQDYGVLSFAQADIGLNPLTNLTVSTLGALIPGAGAPRRVAVNQGETLADLAERLNVDVDDIVRYNREVFIDTPDFGSSNLYNGLLGGNIDPETLVLPVGAAFNLPGSSLWDALSDSFMPFGEINSPHEFATTFIPSALRWVMAGLALQNQPTDEFWKDSDLDGIFGGILPEINEAQVASQLNEAFMYLEAHDLVDGKGPFTRIQEKEAQIAELLNQGKDDEANALRVETNLDIEAFLDRAQKVAAESLILRGLTGNALPTTPGHVRLEEEKIRAFWDTREYADSLRRGQGEFRLHNFKDMEEVEQYKSQLAGWLDDPTGDRARAVFRQNNPQLMAYLTPKTFYKEPVPALDSYEEYQRQIESGEREASPLHVTMWRSRSASIQADYYNKFIASFGNDPLEAAANAMNNRQVYQELNDERDLNYQALEMWDDMHGGVYNQWREENYEDVETWAQDQINDKLNTIRDNLSVLLELEDNFDVELDLDGVANLNSTIRGAIAQISDGIRNYNELTERVGQRNAYEVAINRYFQEIYVPYAEQISDLYDQLPEVADSERQSLIYEQIKFIKNEYAGVDFYLDGDTTTPFPSPLEYSWQGKSPEEQQIKMQQWITRPIEWMDLDQSMRILQNTPAMAGFVPNGREAFDIYREYTLDRIMVDEMFEAGEITNTQRTKMRERLETQLRSTLIQQGREGEVLMMDYTPYEKLELAGLLHPRLGIFGDHVRYYKQVLAAAEKSAGTQVGREIVAPLYDMVEAAFYTDPEMRMTLQELGINLLDKDNLDAIMPWLFFGHTGER